MNIDKFTRWSAVTISCLFLLQTNLSHASEIGGYAGVGAGYAVLDELEPDTDQADVGTKLYGGIRLFGPLGIEAGVYNLGTYNTEQDKVTGTVISAVANLDTKSVSLFAKAGIINWKSKDITPGGVAISGTDTAIGLGINIPIEKRLIFRAEWERFSKIGKDTPSANPGMNLSLLTFGVNFMF